MTPNQTIKHYPLSSPQREIWFDQILHPDVPLYNIGGYVRIDGSIEPSLFEKALNQVIHENDALRIILHEGESLPTQTFAENVRIKLDFHDFSEKENAHESAFKWMAQAYAKPFQLYDGLLFQFALCKAADNCYYWLMKYHHIIVDGWATSLIVQRVATAYNALVTGQSSEHNYYSYQDFIQNDQAYFESEKFVKAKRYWQEKYKKVPEPLLVRRYAIHKPSQIITSQSSTLRLKRSFYNQLNDFALKNKASMFHVILGALYCYFVRTCHREDLVIGLPTLNRNTAAFKQTVGLFVGVSPAWFRFGTDLNFVELVEKIRQELQKDYRHQRFPLGEINRQVGLHSHQQLFDIMLSYAKHNYDVDFNGSSAKTVYTTAGFEQNALAIYVEEFHQHDDVNIYFDCNLGFFDAYEIERIKARFEFLLGEILRQPSVPVWELQIMPDAELNKILVEWNNTATDYPRDKTIVDLFEEQVAKTPNAIAVVFENQQLTYLQLNTKANQLAHYLQTLGVKPEVLVGICVERSIEMVIGLLGILKAGGAYLPLDPAYPAARLAFMLEDAQVSVLLTQSSLKEGLPTTQAQKVCLDVEAEALSQSRSENPVSDVKPDNLAYVIYTSGSTGKPKGVGVYHRGLTNLVNWFVRDFNLTATDSVLVISPFGFDLTQKNFLAPLIKGGQLHLLPASIHYDPNQITQIITEQQITWLNCTPSAFYPVCEFRENNLFQKLVSLRYLFLGGEPIALTRLLPWLQSRACQAKVVNTYGPTECTDVCAAYLLEQPESFLTQPIPIGKPIFNAKLFILGKHLEVLPIGVAGELYIGGVGLARGYLNRPDLTGEKFINNPFDDDLNSRLYKTGDLARYLPDGNIEYLGRIDHQVKVRGFRIELGEIEAALAQHPDVLDNAVIVHEASKTDKRLVAYFVPHQGQVIENTTLRNFLTERLPDYMIPSAFVTLENLPLTPNGKIDRRALSQLSVKSLKLSKEAFVAPRTPDEKLLAEIWAEVLGIERVGIHDNFFELGGDSIISIQVISRANQAGDLQLTPRQLFQHQTIAELATVAKTCLSRQAEQGLVTGKVPLSPIQHWFFEQELPEAHHFNQAVLLKVSPELQLEQLEAIISQLLQHHDALRLRFSDSREQMNPSDCSLNPSDCSLIKVKDLSELTCDPQHTAIESTTAELQTSLNFIKGPLWRVALFKMGHNQPNRLFFVIHHLAVDGVSWRILLEDVITAYQQLSRGEVIALPQKTTSFQQWAKRLTEYAISDTLNAELDEWLADARWQVKPLPVDYPASHQANTVANTTQVTVSLNVEQTRALLSEVPKAYRTQINDVLLTALVQSFAGWSGENILLIDLEGHGREELFEEIDLSRTVGWFTSIFPVLLDLRAVPDNAGAYLKTIKEQLGQIPQHGIGYGALRYLNTEATSRLQALPQAQVSFNYLGQFHHFSTEPLLGLASENSGAIHGAANPRSHLLEIDGLISEEQLRFDWSYSKNHFKSSTIERLAQSFITALQALIAHCQLPEIGGYTPSDFPLAHINQSLLDRIIGNRQINDIYPLSQTQKEMLFYTLDTPTSGAYIVQSDFILEGSLNHSAFRRAWQHLIDRHAVLRTAFVWESLETPLQLVHSQVKLSWLQQDWRDLTTIEQRKQLAEFLHADLKMGFDLNRATLMRCALIQVTDEHYHFIWTQHHIIIDGWSSPLLFKEVFAFYKAFCQERQLRLEQPRSYRNYITWLQQQDISETKAFWRVQLKGFTAPTPFRVDKQMARCQKYDYEEQTFSLSKATTEALQSLARQHHLTLNTLVQGAWALLLSRYSRKADIVFGATVSGRSIPLTGVESMVGLFINTLPVRVSISEETLLLPWLQQLHAEQVEREQYSFTPLTDIQKWSDVPSKTPLFESIIVFENYPIDSDLKKRISPLKILSVDTIDRNKYPLTLMVFPASELSFIVSYQSNRFGADTISQLMTHVKMLLEAMVANQAPSIGELLLLTECN